MFFVIIGPYGFALERAGLREPERPRDVGDAVGDPGTGERGDREREAERERIWRRMPCRQRQPTGLRPTAACPGKISFQILGFALPVDLLKKRKRKLTRLPWRGKCGRAAAARALFARCAAGYARDCTGSPVRF